MPEWGDLLAWLPAVDWRAAVRLVLLSALSVLLCAVCFKHNAPTRRLLILVVCGVLLIVPWLLPFDPLVFGWPTDDPVALPGSLPMTLVLIWFCVALVLMAATVFRAIAGQRAVRELVNFPQSEVQSVVAELRAHLPVPAELEVKIATPAVPGPSSASLLHPTIVLPADAAEWPAATLRAVLCHEAVHLLRRDDVGLLLVRLVRWLYWCFPWVGGLERSYQQSIEESCDDRASEILGDDVVYMDGVVDGVRRCAATPVSSVLTQLNAHPLVARIGRLASPRFFEVDSTATYWLLIAGLFLVLLATGVRPEQQRGEPTLVEQPRWLTEQPVAQARTFPKVESSTSPPIYSPRSPQPIPIYPGEALADQQEGFVRMAFVLGADGRPYRVRIVGSEPPGLFDDSALRALNDTRYTTAPQSPSLISRPQESALVTQTYRFRLVHPN